jgi:hypothetical protein
VQVPAPDLETRYQIMKKKMARLQRELARMLRTQPRNAVADAWLLDNTKSVCPIGTVGLPSLARFLEVSSLREVREPGLVVRSMQCSLYNADYSSSSVPPLAMQLQVYRLQARSCSVVPVAF